MAGARRYAGSCQCGAVRYTVETALGELFDCNCSRCRRLGAVMTAVPASDFTLLSGKQALRAYRFHHHAIEHLFCGNCGVQTFARGQGPGGRPTVVLNVGCLEDAPPIERAAVTHYDGARA